MVSRNTGEGGVSTAHVADIRSWTPKTGFSSIRLNFLPPPILLKSIPAISSGVNLGQVASLRPGRCRETTIHGHMTTYGQFTN